MRLNKKENQTCRYGLYENRNRPSSGTKIPKEETEGVTEFIDTKTSVKTHPEEAQVV